MRVIKFIFVSLLFSSLQAQSKPFTFTAQTATLSTSIDIAEAIPDGAVEPVYIEQIPVCPREEYDLRWYVVRKTDDVQFTYGGASIVGTTQGSYVVLNAVPKYKFQPVCVVGMHDDGKSNYSKLK